MDIISFLMIITIMTGIFMLSRYVFLEPAMEEKKQRVFYIASYVLVVALFFFFGSMIAQMTALLLGGLNVFLGRKKRRVLGFFLMLPLAGIMNGICAPIIMMQVLFQAWQLEDTIMYLLCTTGVYLVEWGFVLLFYLKGKNWRRWFGENMKNRRPTRSEYTVLWVSGLTLCVTNSTMNRILLGGSTSEVTQNLVTVQEIYAAVTFLLAITIIVLIMQGNRRKFYLDRVSNMQFSVIATMADIVENRDSNTGGHIKRTAKYVEIISKTLKKQNAFPEILTDEYISDMIVAAPLHDIGKISIPDAILNKPGKLTDEEFAIMKTHASAGREVLMKAEKQLGEFEYLEVALDMAEYHHEWWNGKGYPGGVSGEEIPLCARIMAVADVFDALTSKRCYKAAMPLEKAYGIIREETGTHFDPVVAEAFLSARKEIDAAMAELADEEPEESTQETAQKQAAQEGQKE